MQHGPLSHVDKSAADANSCARIHGSRNIRLRLFTLHMPNEWSADNIFFFRFFHISTFHRFASTIFTIRRAAHTSIMRRPRDTVAPACTLSCFRFIHSTYAKLNGKLRATAIT